MPAYWTDGASVARRAAISQLQRRLRRRAYWGPDGLSWAMVRAGGYIVIVVSVSILVTVALAG